MKKHFTIENCCDQLRAILRLKRLMKVKTLEESEDYYPKVKSTSVSRKQTHGNNPAGVC